MSYSEYSFNLPDVQATLRCLDILLSDDYSDSSDLLYTLERMKKYFEIVTEKLNEQAAPACDYDRAMGVVAP